MKGEVDGENLMFWSGDLYKNIMREEEGGVWRARTGRID